MAAERGDMTGSRSASGTYTFLAMPERGGYDGKMLILLTNDDGIYAPGLAAIERELRTLGDVVVVAPAVEQSGVGHSITYLTPLIVKEVFRNEAPRATSAAGAGPSRAARPIASRSASSQFCPRPPDLVVSGINGGLNAGINVLYSGTVAAAIEGAFFGITSVAVSLEFDEHARFDKAARLAREIIRQILEKKGAEPQLYNLNIPTAALGGVPEICVVPMNVIRYEDSFEQRLDPWGREYYWLIGGPPKTVAGHETDLSALAQGKVTITPLDYNMTRQAALAEMERWQFQFTQSAGESEGDPPTLTMPTVRTRKRKQQEVVDHER